jgi:single-strand DNA-binding protein
MNKVIAKGNLATDPIERTTAGGTTTCSFKLAVNRPPRTLSDGTVVEKADYFWVKCFGNQAKACAAHLVKGSEVLIDGMLDAGDNLQDDGSYKSYSEVAARTVEFLRRPNSQTAPASEQAEVAESVEAPSSSDVPF